MTLKVLVLCKRTSFRKLVEQDGDPRIKSLLAKGDVTVRRMRGSHDDHEATVREVESTFYFKKEPDGSWYMDLQSSL